MDERHTRLQDSKIQASTKVACYTRNFSSYCVLDDLVVWLTCSLKGETSCSTIVWLI
jgi:hypothetical protein